MEISSAHHQSNMTNLPQHQHQQLQQQQQQQQQERKTRPQQEQALNCPRCNSTNTKFCYYNNYSLSQPRYFCKGCRRYWTQGGSLRNVPVGGGCRKNKRSSTTSNTTTSNTSSKKPLDPQTIDPLLSYPISTLNHYHHHHEPFLLGNPNPSLNLIPNMPTGAGFLDILRGGFLDSTTTTTTTSTVMNPNPNPNPSFMHNFFYGFDGGNAGVEEAGSVGEELMIPFEGCKVGGEGGDQNNKMMMGMQWQMNGGDGSMGVDSSREYWNGSSWHGIMNNSMM